MKTHRRWTRAAVAAAGMLLGASLLVPGPAQAHCDGLDGPVVTAARQALEKADANRVLAWVRPSDEPAIRKAFAQALAVRGLGPQAREMADTYFFETLVRVHREGEGAPYTGLKPAGTDLGPAIPAADRALETGDLAPLGRMLAEALERGLHQRFEAARASRDYPAGTVEAGRRYVEQYVRFLHYVEGLHAALATGAAGHEPGSKAATPHEH